MKRLGTWHQLGRAQIYIVRLKIDGEITNYKCVDGFQKCTDLECLTRIVNDILPICNSTRSDYTESCKSASCIRSPNIRNSSPPGRVSSRNARDGVMPANAGRVGERLGTNVDKTIHGPKSLVGWRPAWKDLNCSL
jgi:hypothetical protein